MISLIVLPLFFVGNMAQVPMAKPCNLTAMENLDVTQLMGRWYEYLRYPIEHVQSKCETADIVENPDGTVILTVSFLPLNATSRNDTVLNHDTMQFSGSQLILTALDGPLSPANGTFLSTDYESYFITGWCIDAGPNSLYNYWIYGRTSEPSQSVVEQINRVFEDQEIPEQYFEAVNQTNCEAFR